MTNPGAQARSGKDFYEMSGPDLLEYCGCDASKWSEAFCRIKEVQGWSAADIDEGLMIGWFANAIEHSSMLRVQEKPVNALEAPSAEDIARTICLSYGRDPDEPAPALEMCDANNQPVSTWRIWEEQAEAILAKYPYAALAHPAIGTPDNEVKAMAAELRRGALSTRDHSGPTGWIQLCNRAADMLDKFAIGTPDICAGGINPGWDECEKCGATADEPCGSAAIGAPDGPADQIIGQIEERFPDWRGFRDLVDCIDVTLHHLRRGTPNDAREALQEIIAAVEPHCEGTLGAIRKRAVSALAALPPEQDEAKTMREALEECVAMIRQLRLEVPTKAVAALAHSRPVLGGQK